MGMPRGLSYCNRIAKETKRMKKRTSWQQALESNDVMMVYNSVASGRVL